MPDYKEMYFSLFNSITDAIELLKYAQMKSEELYIKSADDAPILSVFKGEGEATSKPNANS
ncbi:hypothetical protein DRA42_02440 [Ethanoligenens harbinense]|nr:hypothetical protein CXQ68_02430 [Ethanoligenens harbinense YUAN-3]AYF37887.1 hypothetical protein CXP51_02440 [Ethanoligenens harbinense]AYF40611.1 hypothetical protein CN246_02435 [Ethanoligenens harbinense]QCN91444.1 hypothetical protein DRA42_02440 [Ethanoligenens harbinense]